MQIQGKLGNINSALFCSTMFSFAILNNFKINPQTFQYLIQINFIFIYLFIHLFIYLFICFTYFAINTFKMFYSDKITRSVAVCCFDTFNIDQSSKRVLQLPFVLGRHTSLYSIPTSVCPSNGHQEYFPHQNITICDTHV